MIAIQALKTARQDVFEHRARQIAVVGKLRRTLDIRRGIHGKDEGLTRTRHGDIKQASTLLQLRLAVLILNLEEFLAGRARGAHVVHELWHHPLTEQPLEVLFDLRTAHARSPLFTTHGEPLRQRNDVHMVGGCTHLHAATRHAHVKAVGDRDHRELQALGGVDRHDAHGRSVALVQRARSLLALQEGIEGKRDLARQVAPFAFKLGKHVKCLEHVGSLGTTLSTLSFQTHEPAGLVHHVTRDARERVVPRARKGATQNLTRTIEQRQIAKTRCIL